MQKLKLFAAFPTLAVAKKLIVLLQPTKNELKHINTNNPKKHASNSQASQVQIIL